MKASEDTNFASFSNTPQSEIPEYDSPAETKDNSTGGAVGGGEWEGGRSSQTRGIPSKKRTTSWYVDILNKPWFLLRFLYSGLRVIKELNLRF